MGISTEEDRDEVVVEAVIQQEHGLESLDGYPHWTCCMRCRRKKPPRNFS
jgi:hypothetical protein